MNRYLHHADNNLIQMIIKVKKNKKSKKHAFKIYWEFSGIYCTES